MKIILFFSFISLFSGFPAMVSAAVVPSIVEGQGDYSKEDCVATATNNCIQTICETSSELDCEDQCRISAVQKCKEINE